MFKKSILSLSVLFLSFALTGCGDTFTSATMNQENLTAISESSAFNDNEINYLQQKMEQCQGDETCLGKLFYEAYDKAFVGEGFSQIGSAINFLQWTKEITQKAPTMESQKLSIGWGNAFMGTFRCIKNENCTKWLIDSGKAKEQEIQLFKKLESELS